MNPTEKLKECEENLVGHWPDCSCYNCWLVRRVKRLTKALEFCAIPYSGCDFDKVSKVMKAKEALEFE